MKEKDLELLNAYKACWADVKAKIAADEAVDPWVCRDETLDLVHYTGELMY